MVIALVLVGTCSDPQPPDAGTDAGAASSADASVTPDSPPDAAPDVTNLFCTGRPIPAGLTCVTQDTDAVGACGGRGGVGFDGLHCRAVRGDECASAGLGAFDSLEECAVTCAAAGHCEYGALMVLPGDGGHGPAFCGDAPAECVLMDITIPEGISPSCAVWGLFSGGHDVTPSELPYPQQWDVIWSLTLVGEYVGRVTCGQDLM